MNCVEQQAVDASGRPDRVAGDDRHAADDPVGEEAPLVLVKKYDLSARSTKGASVSTPQAATSVAREPPLARLLAQAVAPRREPAAAAASRTREPDRNTESGNQSPNPLAEMRRAAERAPRRAAPVSRTTKPERVRLVGREPVEPERERAVGEDPAARSTRAQREGAGVPSGSPGASNRAAGPPARRDEGGRRGAELNPWSTCSSGEPPSSADRDLPRAPLPPRETAGDDQEREPERRRRARP